MDIDDSWMGIYGRKIPLSEQKYEIVKQKLQNIFDIPVYRLDNEKDQEQIVTEIVDFFD